MTLRIASSQFSITMFLVHLRESLTTGCFDDVRIR